MIILTRSYCRLHNKLANLADYLYDGRSRQFPKRWQIKRTRKPYRRNKSVIISRPIPRKVLFAAKIKASHFASTPGTGKLPRGTAVVQTASQPRGGRLAPFTSYVITGFSFSFTSYKLRSEVKTIYLEMKFCNFEFDFVF